METVEYEKIRGKWFWFAKDVMGRRIGASWKGFSSKRSCEHNASRVGRALFYNMGTSKMGG